MKERRKRMKRGRKMKERRPSVKNEEGTPGY
jgi:hypothetical protein